MEIKNMNDYTTEDNIIQALTRAVDEGIRIGREIGYKKASEELQPYIDLYKDLAEKAEKVAREVIDKYPKWTPATERLPDYDEDVLVTDFYGILGWGMHVWHRTHDGKGTDYWEAEDGHFVSINYTEYWMPRPKPPKESEKDD
jgi:hypothetical protein